MANSGYKTNNEQIASLRILEASELVRALEERLGVSARIAAEYMAETEVYPDHMSLGVIDKNPISAVLESVITKLLAAITLAGRTRLQQPEVEWNMQDDQYNEEENTILLAVLPVFRELARGAHLRSVDEVFDEHLARKQRFLAEYRGKGGNEYKPA